MRKFRIACSLALSYLVVSVQISGAAIIFSDLGPGNTYSITLGAYSVTGGTGGSAHLVNSAAAFTPASDYVLTQIDVAIGNKSGTNGVAVLLTTDSGGIPSNGNIANWMVAGLPNLFSTNNVVQTLVPTSTVNLHAGQQYWIIAGPSAQDTFDGWNSNSIGAMGTVSQDQDGLGWTTSTGQTLPAFDVLGSPVPEPSMALLLSTGILGFAAVGVRCQRM